MMISDSQSLRRSESASSLPSPRSAVLSERCYRLLVIRLLIAEDYKLMEKQTVYDGNSLATS